MPRACATATASATRSAMSGLRLLRFEQLPVGLAGDRRERIDAHVDHQLAPHEARNVLLHVRLEARGCQGLAQAARASRSSRPPCAMCVGPLPGVPDAPGPEERRPLGGDPGRRPLRRRNAGG